MTGVDLILKKRNGVALTEEEIRFLIDAYVRGSLPEYQMAALLMAVYFKGLTFEETACLTRAMIDSGDVIDLSSSAGPFIDKHSTGGVGDKVSLILAPLAAACGIKVPMMSGRSLGHTGGTLDKLESIPGYRTGLSAEEFKRCIERVGFAMMGQSEMIVPADRKMYALRDVTGTIESIPLITASILSKKFAEGAEGLLLDVKAGSGAFMRTREEAEELGHALCRTGKALGRKIAVVVTDMDQPLGNCVGNFLEIREAADCLRAKGPPDLMEVTLALTSRMLLMGNVTHSTEDALRLCNQRLEDGSAWEKFIMNIEIQGGDPHTVIHPERGPAAALIHPITAADRGFIRRIDARQVGMAATILGAGRRKREDTVLPGVGIEFKKKSGDRVTRKDIICLVHAETRESLQEALLHLDDAVLITDEPGQPKSLVLNEMNS